MPLFGMPSPLTEANRLQQVTTPHPPQGPDIYEWIALTVAEHGWCVTPGFLSPLLVAQMRHEVQSQWQEGQFRKAGVGRGRSFEVNTAIRNDHVKWLGKDDTSAAQKYYLDALEQLRQALNRTTCLGLFDFECHLSIYPPGSYYKKHLDQFRGIGLRTVTTILYLNENWQQSDGGQLCLYTNPADEQDYQLIQPHGGQLVTFLSARFWHEVLQAHRERMSITGWFSKRDINAIF
jgi:SM-20-related protein